MTGKLHVYAAEEAAGLGYGCAPDLGLIEARRWINRVRQRPRVELIAGGPVPWIEVIPGRSGSRATANVSWNPDGTVRAERVGNRVGWRIVAPDGHRHVAILTHELAHLVAWWKYGRTIQTHGPEWRGIYLALLSQLVGQDAERALRREFRGRGLEILRPLPRSVAAGPPEREDQGNGGGSNVQTAS